MTAHDRAFSQRRVRLVGRPVPRRLAQARAAADASNIVLGCVAGVPGTPEAVYHRVDFERTGRVDEWGESEMITAIERLLVLR